MRLAVELQYESLSHMAVPSRATGTSILYKIVVKELSLLLQYNLNSHPSTSFDPKRIESYYIQSFSKYTRPDLHHVGLGHGKMSLFP